MRNWWAHVNVGIDDCAAALQAVADFLGRVLKHLKLSDTSGLDQLNSIIDSISISKLDGMTMTECTAPAVLASQPNNCALG